MDRLVIRDGELRGAITSVRTSRTEFAQAVSRTDALQEAVGHRRLSDALQAFEARWSVRREKLVTTLEVIENQLQGVLDTFGELDRAFTPPAGGPGGPGGAAPQPSSTAAAAPPAPVAPTGSAPGGVPAGAPAPMPDAPAPVTPTVDATPSVDPSLPGEPVPSSSESDAGPLSDDQDSSPVIPGSPEAINDLLDRLEQLANTPAGLAALAGSVGALVVLLALFAPGATAVPGLAGVDGARVQKLLDRYTASTPDAFGELTTSPAPSGDPVEVDVARELDQLAAGELDSEVPAEAVEEIVTSGESDESGEVAEVADADSADSGQSDASADGSGSVPGVEMPVAPPTSPDAGAAGATPLGDLPPLPEPPAPPGTDPAATSSAFDEQFPGTSGREGLEVPVAGTGSPTYDIDTELAALAAHDTGTEADTGEDSGSAPVARMSGMPMATAGMGSMAAASAGQSVTSAQAKAGDAGNDERLAAVRRELDELRNPTTDKDGKP